MQLTFIAVCAGLITIELGIIVAAAFDRRPAVARHRAGHRGRGLPRRSRDRKASFDLPLGWLKSLGAAATLVGGLDRAPSRWPGLAGPALLKFFKKLFFATISSRRRLS